MLISNSKISIIRQSAFDGVELKSAVFINKSFPVHFHHDWSFVLMEEGSEITTVKEQTFQLHANTLIITPSYIPHSGSGNLNAYWKYKALHLTNDVVKFLLKSIQLDYSEISENPYLVSFDIKLINQFKRLDQIIRNNQSSEAMLSYIFLEVVKPYTRNPDMLKVEKFQIDYLEELKMDIRKNFREKLSLADLSKKFRTNKFNILRQFRKYTGLTPQEYMMALRIEYAKEQIYSQNTLVDIAYISGFYDPSHFSHYFKKYVGVSPSDYQKNLQYFTRESKA